MQILFMVALLLTATFLILIILVQRGKGGGLAGAFGGMGGQSAFGTKAGDLFTKITIGFAVAWIVLCLIGVKGIKGTAATNRFGDGLGGKAKATQNQPVDQPAENADQPAPTKTKDESDKP